MRAWRPARPHAQVGGDAIQAAVVEEFDAGFRGATYESHYDTGPQQKGVCGCS